MFNLKNLTSRNAYQRILSLFMVMAIIFSALPCNCMAESKVPEKSPIEQSSENHPCHSSEKVPEDQSSSHDNCCCTDASFLSASDLDTVKLDNQKNLNEKSQTDYLYSSLIFINKQLDDTKLIRGSPPTSKLLTISSNTILSFLQRWLI